MASQWENFQRNLGEWRGSFTSLTADGTVLESSPSVLTLDRDDDGRLVRFGLRRWPAGTVQANAGGPGDGVGEPTREVQQDYRTLGRQVVFFASGSFCKGALQVAPATPCGGEFGFIEADRRHRLVQLYGSDGSVQQLVLIREFRAGSGAVERQATTADQLLGQWQGEQATITADWPEPEVASSSLELDSASLSGFLLLPDGGFCRFPQRVSHRESFTLEAGWLPEPGRMERLIRRYDGSGAWISATQEQLRRC